MKSYGYVKDNEVTLHMTDYIPHFNPISEVEVPDGHLVGIEGNDHGATGERPERIDVSP